MPSLISSSRILVIIINTLTILGITSDIFWKTGLLWVRREGNVMITSGEKNRKVPV